jgi:membrane associated rhomboid family serine protease
MMNMTPTVKQLLIINVLFYIGITFVPAAFNIFSLSFFENQNFKVWQPITYIFVNVGFLQLFFSLFALYSFGSMMESIWGTKKFLFFYISCGLGAAFIYSIVNYYYFHRGLDVLIENGESKIEIYKILAQGRYNTAWEEVLSASDFNYFMKAYSGVGFGAAGALYGLLTAYAFMFPNMSLYFLFIPIPIKAKYYVAFILGSDLFSGVTGISIFGGGIEHFSSVGGAVFGFIMVWYWKKKSPNQNTWG